MAADFQGVTQTAPSTEPGLTTFSRLEALPVDSDLGPALQAQIADPLWMLARQWQFAEFQGEDAGSPIAVRLTGERSRLSRYLAGPLDDEAAARAVDYAHLDLPLEVEVEREAARAPNARLAADAGLQFGRILAARRLTALLAPFIANYPLQIAIGEDDPDRRGTQWATLARGRALDGRALASAIREFAPPGASEPLTDLPFDLRATARQTGAVRQAAADWLRWYDDAISEDPGNDAWNPHRQEYALAVSATLSDGEAVLVADEYTDGELDWYSFRAAADATLGTAPESEPELLQPRPLLPVRVRYPGMPVDRLWEFEDANVSFGRLETAPTDLTRLLLAEFALVYGNDWFVVPVEMAVGSLFAITALTVTDTFGEVTEVRATRMADDSGWTMFSLSAPDGPDHAHLRDLFFLPPTLPTKLQGDPLEEVALFRDEMANMAWAVERKVQGAAGVPFERYDERAVISAHRQIDTAGVTAEIVYRLATPVAPNWLPFVPVPVPLAEQPPGDFAMQLERRVIEHSVPGEDPLRAHPKGQLLRMSASGPVEEDVLWLAEEEVPRAGAVVTRAFQRTRWLGGTSHLWVGRSKRIGKGEGSSGLRYDTLQPRS